MGSERVNIHRENHIRGRRRRYRNVKAELERQLAAIRVWKRRHRQRRAETGQAQSQLRTVRATLESTQAALARAEQALAEVVTAGMGLQQHVQHFCDSIATINEPDCACGLRAKMAVLLKVYRSLAASRQPESGAAVEAE